MSDSGENVQTNGDWTRDGNHWGFLSLTTGNNEHAVINNVVALSWKDDSITYIQGSDKVKNKVKMVSQWGNISIFCCVQ